MFGSFVALLLADSTAQLKHLAKLEWKLGCNKNIHLTEIFIILWNPGFQLRAKHIKNIEFLRRVEFYRPQEKWPASR